MGGFFIFIYVLKWDEIQGRRGPKVNYWFKVEHRLIVGSEHLGAKGPEILAWIYILALCSETNDALVEIHREHQELFGRLQYGKFEEAAKNLENFNWIKTFEKRPTAAEIEQLSRVEQTKIKKTKVSIDPAEYEILEVLQPIAHILEGRKITKELQLIWIQSYSRDFIIQKVNDLKAWEITAGPKGRKKNWGRFYSNCFSKDWDSWSKRLPQNFKGKQKSGPNYDALDEYAKESAQWKE